MSSKGERQRVIVISDNDLLFKAIERNLNNHLQIAVHGSVADTSAEVGEQADQDGWDLMIVAVSEPVGEPVVELVRASLARWLGQVPLLIISQRPFDSRPEEKIVHLSFPFSPAALRDTVAHLLPRGGDVTEAC
jgi:DNA-binding response OmpR family regulator